jgi:ribosomal protein L21E
LEDAPEDDTAGDSRTDEEKGLSHGYEGPFKIGDEVRVKISTKLYHVKQHSKVGFDPHGMTGKVVQLVLYGRKKKSLCSAITPVKIEVDVDGPGVPQGLFEKKWQGHFSGEELELVKKA